MSVLRNIWIAGVAALSLSLTAGGAWAEVIYGEATAVDGDTLIVNATTIRLFGIDTPEAGQTCPAAAGSVWACGSAATDRLSELLSLGPIACEGGDLDDYGRTLAVCDASDGTQVNATLVVEGFAWAFVRYSTDYVEQEAAARSAGLGIWQAPTEPAWDYRADARAAIIDNQPTPPGDCLIKGNINRDGERIYHLPSTPSYTETVIRLEDGERWFCTEQEAIDAGWRAPLLGVR